MIRWIAATGSLGLMFGVILGAFGAHALRSRISPEHLTIFETGVRYHFIHALALLVIGFAGSRLPLVNLTAALYLTGIVVFSGSLYLLAVTGNRTFGAITPLGGLAFIIGHALLTYGILTGPVKDVLKINL